MAITFNGSNITFNSGSVLQNPQYARTVYFTACLAYVTWDGTGATGANQTIKASARVSSVGHSAVGVYTINFSSSLYNVPCCIFGFAEGESLTNSSAASVESAAIGSVTVNFEDLDAGYVNSPWASGLFYG